MFTVRIHFTSFVARPEVVRVNETFNLSCTALGYPPPDTYHLTKSDNRRINLTNLTYTEDGVYITLTALPSYNGSYSCFAFKTGHEDLSDRTNTEVTVYSKC